LLNVFKRTFGRSWVEFKAVNLRFGLVTIPILLLIIPGRGALGSLSFFTFFKFFPHISNS
jgi:hypothetical protein